MLRRRKKLEVERDMHQMYDELQRSRRRQILRLFQEVRERRQWKNGSDEERDLPKEDEKMTYPEDEFILLDDSKMPKDDEEEEWGRRKYGGKMGQRIFKRMNRRKERIKQLKLEHKRVKYKYYNISKTEKQAPLRTSKKAYLWIREWFKMMMGRNIHSQYDIWRKGMWSLYEVLNTKQDKKEGEDTEEFSSFQDTLKKVKSLDTPFFETDSLDICLNVNSLRIPSVKDASGSSSSTRCTFSSGFESPNGVSSYDLPRDERKNGRIDQISERQYTEKGESCSLEFGKLFEKGDVVSSIHVERPAEGDALMWRVSSSQEDFQRREDNSFGRAQRECAISIPNNVITDEKKASEVISSKHAGKSSRRKKNRDGVDGDGDNPDDSVNKSDDHPKNKERKKISLFGHVKPVDIINRGVDAYPILRNQQNLYVDVLIIGSGISGLAAAYYLNKCNADILVIEGRNRIGGRAYSTILPERIINNNLLPETVVDLGANYLHCCENADVPNDHNAHSNQGDKIHEENYFTKKETLSMDSGLSVGTDNRRNGKSKKARKKFYYRRNNKRMKVRIPPDKKKEFNPLDPSNMEEMEKRLSNNVNLFKQQYAQLMERFGKIPLYSKAHQEGRNRTGERQSPEQSGNGLSAKFAQRRGEDDDPHHSYSDSNYFQARKQKKEKKKKIRKNILFMVKYNIDNICNLYSYIYKQMGLKKKKKDLLTFLKDMDENICVHTYLSDSCLSSDSSFPSSMYSSSYGDKQPPFLNGSHKCSKRENKKLKILSVNKDTRRRRGYDKSVTQLANKLKPKISLVCGKDNWESTFYAYWYNNESGKQVKTFKIYRMNLLCDKIRVRAARKIKTYLFINNNRHDTTVDNYPSCMNFPGEVIHHSEKKGENQSVSVQDIKGAQDGYEEKGKEEIGELQKSIKSDFINTNIAEEQCVKRMKVMNESRSKKKCTWTGSGVDNYDKDSIIYENYYDYGEEYYRIVRKATQPIQPKATQPIQPKVNEPIQPKVNEPIHPKVNEPIQPNANEPIQPKATHSIQPKDKKDIKSTFLFNEHKERRSMWDLLIECTEEILEEMNIHQDNFSLEEWKILMVMLQSRYGYGSDLRETSIAMCRLPFSTYMDIDVCPNYGTHDYILKHFKYYNKIRKYEQIPQVISFKDNTSADQIVLDGWKWLINFLSENIQNKILLSTVAEMVHIKEDGTFWSNDYNGVNDTSHQQGDHLLVNTQGELSSEEDPKNGTHMGNSPHCVRDSTGNYQSGDVFSEGAVQEGKGIHSAHNGKHPRGVKRTHEYYINGDEKSKGLEVVRNRCRPGENQENYNVMVQCKSYDTSKKQINKHFHGTSNLTNCNYAKVNIFAKYVIVALPLGCLTNNEKKKKKKKSYLQFEPKLHPLKIKALNNYRMGNHNKIILRFYPFDFDWPFDSLQLNCIDQKFQFLNLHAYGKIGCVLVHCFPPWSCTYGYIKNEHYIVNECLYTLHKMFENTGKKLPILVDYLITKWQDDNFSFGSYAYPHVNCTDNDLIYLRAPHPIDNPKVVFCGEYLSKSYFQCVDGAYDTGIRAAEDIAHIGLKLGGPDTKRYNTDVFFFPQDTCPFTNIPLPKVKNNLLGFYITDGSDEALTDYESSSEDDDVSNLSNIPLSLLKGEHDFLSYSLNNILKFFDHLKGDAFCKSDDGNQRREGRGEKQSSVEGGGITVEKTHTDRLKRKVDSPASDGDFSEDLVHRSIALVSPDLSPKWLNSWETSFTGGNRLTSSSIHSTPALYTHGRIEHCTSLSNYDEFSLYIDKNIIKMNDIIFHNYNETELNSIRKESISPVFLKSKFLLSQYLSSVLSKYHHFRHFIQRELFAKIEAAKDVLVDHFEWSNLPNNPLGFPFLNEKITDHTNAQMSEKKKWESAESCIFPEQTSSWMYSGYKPPSGGAHDETLLLAVSPYTAEGIRIDQNCLNGSCKKEEKTMEEHKIYEKNMNSSEKKGEKENAHMELATMRKEKINHMYVQNREISELNIYLKYFLSQNFSSDKSVEENIIYINKYQKIKLNCTGFLFFVCYLLKYIIKETNYDTCHYFIDSSVIIQLLCDYIYHLIFYKHDVLCYKCVNGGELIMCDFLGCTQGWHSYCLCSKAGAEEQKSKRKWICPSCLSTNLSQIFKRGFYNQNEIIQNYWKRRVYIYKIKFFLSRTRRIRRRLDLLQVELSKRIN
ncbi:lysine-specific histone demethylase 1, putative [Plasmodium knowlesi strain H]|uniref:Lysine-specific histone demethylase 1, putative n=3 Tax=Plasmodium knowlesi TaxID=5850 RepID=A0A5K1VC90_PLAKH|nr:lysine-specific histone demethylase 1, putative [Plasmodium knowlesi strain H]OTN66639.1 putative Flavin containing amine oxidoreductase [Plasmodium knowlesi]CAA9990155.1 lysine-specific histone demethylase 1, putative [Plasmodium knowlesi strain H]SBO25846.1 lysine-specific histone demethylase 1, putative [Plasmodium knowlesi strain H]SBO28628.1 lysine-specific histone demethylase 1, putative [Plasmodium knowlesi strain H]VVS79629.1 lysine-specific histone demethylase 1, putative [Plasmodi|eukprot:XP_002260622.1 Flavin containing amine oxidoreductase,putative [Plasmodium knowlesi strain H]